MQNSHLPQRKSPRLRGYDYSHEGAYFVTICTHERRSLFGFINKSEMVSGALGEIASKCWFKIPDHFPSVELDAFIVMPNHVHGILVLQTTTDTPQINPISTVGTRYSASAQPQLGKIINAYKGAVTRFAKQAGLFRDPIWQSRYHDHIIRDEKALNYIRHYVHDNLARWETDKFYTD